MVYKDIEQRRQYDRDRAATLYRQFRADKTRLIVDIFGDECFLCRRSLGGGVGTHLHHAHYDATESNYPRHSKSMAVRLKRLREAEAHPDRFRALCENCHRAIEAVIPRMHDIDPDRLVQLLVSVR